MDRRQFLSFSAASVFLTACGGGSGSAPEVTPPLIDNSPDTDVLSKLTSEQWQTLKDNVSGRVILPSDEQPYSMARLSFSTRFDHIYPQVVVKCENAQDVQAAIRFAKEHELHIAPRSGSHSYGGYSTTEGMIIDVTDLNNISLQADIATIGSGARLADVYDQLTQQGVSIPAGSCLSVGIAGLTMGGGFGVVDRAHGLTCDTLQAVEIVTADAEIISCDANNHSELFWALRGGGGGNSSGAGGSSVPSPINRKKYAAPPPPPSNNRRMTMIKIFFITRCYMPMRNLFRQVWEYPSCWKVR